MSLCAECGNDMRETSEPLVVDYNGESITVYDIKHLFCDNCGEYEIPASELKQFSCELRNTYAMKHGILTGEQIRAIRERYRLSQVEFGQTLKVTGLTVSRWETGRVQPSSSINELICIMDRHPDVAEELIVKAGIKNEPSVSRSYVSEINQSTIAKTKVFANASIVPMTGGVVGTSQSVTTNWRQSA